MTRVVTNLEKARFRAFPYFGEANCSAVRPCLLNTANEALFVTRMEPTGIVRGGIVGRSLPLVGVGGFVMGAGVSEVGAWVDGEGVLGLGGEIGAGVTGASVGLGSGLGPGTSGGRTTLFTL